MAQTTKEWYDANQRGARRPLFACWLTRKIYRQYDESERWLMTFGDQPSVRLRSSAVPVNHKEEYMWSKRGIQTNVARDNFMSSPSFRDPGALSGTLAGVSFVGGVAGAMAVADSPYPRPGSEPAEIRRYFRGAPARPGSAWSVS